MGIIPNPNAELLILGEMRVASRRVGSIETEEGDVGFTYFMDDDYGASETVEGMISFLYNHYFPRLKWAKLTLKPTKSVFFSKQLGLLEYESSERGL